MNRKCTCRIKDEPTIDIVGYEGIYAVTKRGEVWSYPKRGGEWGGKWLRQTQNSSGYHVVGLHKGGKLKKGRVHRLVATAYIDNPSDKPLVNHINNNRGDNRVENLEWCTQKENMVHAIMSGRKNDRGENNPSSKLTEEDITDIRAFAKNGIKQKDIARVYPVSQANISDIVNRRLWSHI